MYTQLLCRYRYTYMHMRIPMKENHLYEKSYNLWRLAITFKERFGKWNTGYSINFTKNVMNITKYIYIYIYIYVSRVKYTFKIVIAK